MMDTETKKILAQIEDRTFQILQNSDWILLLFENVPIDKVKTNGFYFWESWSFGITSLINFSRGSFQKKSL